jgi:FkbM family methyltransferase
MGMIESLKNTINIIRDNKIVAINANISVYKNDIERDFDYYFNAVIPRIENNFLIADYSKTQEHNIVGFDLFPVLCPSLPDSYQGIKQYMEFSELQPNMVALDLGAYTALGSIVFSMMVGPNGKVIAVEPDSLNHQCCIKNINRFNMIKKYNNIELINAAVSTESKEIYFSGEGCLGSHIINHQGMSRGRLEKVKGLTLYELTKNLNRLDFIKCDIEGPESHIFLDNSFFNMFRPKIIIEPHSNTNECIRAINKHNYKVDIVKQKGISNLPLLECTPL